MGLREEIDAALAEAAAEGGVRQLAVDGDEEVWVAGVAATDGTLEVRVGDRGPRRGLRRWRPDRTVMEAQGFGAASTTRGSSRCRRAPGRRRAVRPRPPRAPLSPRSAWERTTRSSSISAPERPRALVLIPRVKDSPMAGRIRR
jgi:hypothetical protein